MIRHSSTGFFRGKPSSNKSSVDNGLWLYAVTLPLLWFTGLLAPCAIFLLMYLSLRGSIWKRLASDRVAQAWCLVAAIQAVSVIINWADSKDSLIVLLHRLASSPVSGWFFLALAILVGRHHDFASHRIVRANAIIGLYLLIFGGACVAISALLKLQALEVISPVGYLLPQQLPSVFNYFTMRFFLTDDFLGHSIPRLILFYPWSACLAFAGIATFYISLNEHTSFWKAIGISGGLMALIFSLSRAAVVAFLLSLVSYFWLKSSKALKWLSVAVCSLILSIFLISDVSIFRYLTRAYNAISFMREGSSEARSLGYSLV
jgi:hypothetical protein